jgi:broad specificity phosphatase PhoE
MGRLILIRHGESFGNRERYFAADPPELALTPMGYEQARAAARAIAATFEAALIVTSPYVRARETARVIAEALELPLEIEPLLHEREVGVHRGQSYDSVSAAPGFERERPWRYKPEGGESFEEVRERVAPVLDGLARAHPTRDVVVVSHGGVMMCLWAYLTGLWQGAHKPPNCGIVVVEHGRKGYAQPRVIDEARAAVETGG